MFGKNLLRALVVGAILSTMLLSALPAFAAGTSMNVVPSVVEIATVGTEFDVSVVVSTDTPQGSRGFQHGVTFNKDVLQLVSVTKPAAGNNFYQDFADLYAGDGVELTYSSFPNASKIATANSTGSLPFWGAALAGFPAGGTPAGPSGSGTVAIYRFRAIANGNTDIALHTVKVMDKDANFIAGVTSAPSNVQVGPVLRADLVFTAFAVQAVPGDPSNYNVSYTVKNNGSADAAATVARITVDGVAVADQAVAPLAVGASVAMSYGPVAISGASDTVCVTLDATNLVNEGAAGEANNENCGSYSLLSDSGNTIINAQFLAFLEIVPPADITMWNLKVRPDNTHPGTVNVKSNRNYRVDVVDVNPTDWNLTAYEPLGPSYDLSKQIAAELRVLQGSYTATNGASLLIEGGPAGQALDGSGENFGVTFKQAVAATDPVLSSGWNYRLVLTFVAGVVA
ncbi:MAG: CARDB domain-containing protein [Anaerolineae bacterium]